MAVLFKHNSICLSIIKLKCYKLLKVQMEGYNHTKNEFSTQLTKEWNNQLDGNRVARRLFLRCQCHEAVLKLVRKEGVQYSSRSVLTTAQFSVTPLQCSANNTEVSLNFSLMICIEMSSKDISSVAKTLPK